MGKAAAVVAVTLTEAALAAALRPVAADSVGGAGAVAARLLPVVTALVEREAGPDTPEAVANEAAIRCAGWMADSIGRAYKMEAGDTGETFPSGQHSALRHSGALALLGPWKVRRAGVCD